MTEPVEVAEKAIDLFGQDEIRHLIVKVDESFTCERWDSDFNRKIAAIMWRYIGLVLTNPEPLVLSRFNIREPDILVVCIDDEYVFHENYNQFANAMRNVIVNDEFQVLIIDKTTRPKVIHDCIKARCFVVDGHELKDQMSRKPNESLE